MPASPKDVHLETIENLTGTAFDDTLRGDSEDNTFFYTGGLDKYEGRGGVDHVDFSAFGSAVWVDLEFGGVNEAWTQDEPDLIGGVWREIASVDTTENLTGTAFDDTLRGDAANNTLTGGAGDDRLTGRGGNDVFDFNATTFGHDTIIDFTDGLDLLDFTDAGLGVADFTITQQGANTIVNLTADPTQAITLLNFNAAQLDGNDFV